MILSLKLARYEYDKKTKVKDSQAIAGMIHEAIKEHDIIPDEFAELEAGTNLF